MKKFLLVLLVAVVVSVSVTFEEPELEGIDWKKVWQFICSLVGELKALYEKLKKSKYWDELINILEKYGKQKAIDFCIEKTQLDAICVMLVNKLFEILK